MGMECNSNDSYFTSGVSIIYFCMYSIRFFFKIVYIYIHLHKLFCNLPFPLYVSYFPIPLSHLVQVNF